MGTRKKTSSRESRTYECPICKQRITLFVPSSLPVCRNQHLKVQEMKEIEMAEKLSDYEFTRTPRSSKYPWDEWLDGSAWRLEAGTDFKTKVSSFRTSASAAAAERNLGIRTSNEGNGTIVIKAVPKKERKARAKKTGATPKGKS